MKFVRANWCLEAAQAFRPICTSSDMLVDLVLGISANKVALWRVDDHSWLATEVFPGTLWVWCYSGEKFANCAVELAKLALDAKLNLIGWFTFHEFTVASVLKRAPHARIQTTTVPGELRFEIDCEELVRYGSQNSQTAEHGDSSNNQRAHRDDASDADCGGGSGGFRTGPVNHDRPTFGR